MPIIARLVLAYSAITPWETRWTNAFHACSGETRRLSGISPAALIAHQTATRTANGNRIFRPPNRCQTFSIPAGL